MYSLSRALPVASTIVLIAALSACSSQEDPRIALCRGIAADVSGTDQDDWSSAGNRIVRPEYAALDVSGPGEVSCYYEYDAVEEGAVEHANPLQAYATLPYKVVVDGKTLQGRQLQPVLKRQQVDQLKASAEQLKQDAKDAARQAQEGIERTAEKVQQALQE